MDNDCGLEEPFMLEKRVVFRAPMVAELEPFELEQDHLGSTEVIVRTLVTLISPGTELAILHGRLSMHTTEPHQFPKVRVGYANVGIVTAAGDDASGGGHSMRN